MADTAEATHTHPIPAPGIPMKLVVLLLGAVVILAIGGSFAFFKLTTKDHAEEPAKPEPVAAAAEKPAAKPVAAKNNDPARALGAIYDLDPFIVNLADAPDSRYLKLSIKLELEKPEIANELTLRLTQIRDTVLILLSSKESGNLRGITGKFQLRDEITERVNGLLPHGGVRTSYFTEFVVQ